MIRTFRAELVKYRRRRVLVTAAVATFLFAVGSAALVIASASADPAAARDRGPSLASLAGADGGAEVFRTATSFAGTFLFVVFVGAVAAEFSRGTVRTMLLRQPRRVELLAGKLASLLAFTGAVLAGALVTTIAAAAVFAPARDVPVGDWFGVEGLGHALSAYGSTLLWATGYAVLGTLVAVLTRSVPVALAVGIAWAGPFEHLVQDGWEPASRLFPGLLLEAFVAGGTDDVGALRALATVTVYVVAAAATAGAVFARRDVAA